MGRWRRQKGEIHHHQDVQGTRSYNNRKPPQASWQPTVPAWEKRFCISVGSIPWSKLLETKRFMYLYDNVVHWNDSAGEEAFHNAKNRFWAEINGRPCDISLPDPDIYIDEIDWNPDIDPELLSDLEKEPEVPEETNKCEEVVILGSSLLNPSFSCTGWGDAEESFQKGMEKGDNDENLWEHDYTPNNRDAKDNGWDNRWNELPGRNQWECNNNDWDNNYTENDVGDWSTVGDWGARDASNRKREGAGCHMSRYATRFYRDDHPVNHGWRNGRRGKRVDFAYGQPQVESKFASNRWNSISSCQPVCQP